MIDPKMSFFLEEGKAVLNDKFQWPVSCEIDLSNHCQNRCSFCCFKDYLSENRRDLDWEIYCKVLSELVTNGVKSITFTGGGEPTMYGRFGQAVTYAKDLGLDLGLITNGQRMDDVIPFLDMFEFVRVSLDAGCTSTYKLIKGSNKFKLVMEGINKVSRFKIKEGIETTLGLSFVVCKENENEVELFKNFGKIDGIDYIQIKPLFDKYKIHSLSIKDENCLIMNRHKVNSRDACKIAGLVAQIGADGNVYYCCITRGKDDFIIGNLKDENFSTIWRRRRFMKPDISKCVTCRYTNLLISYQEYSKTRYKYLTHRNFL